MQALLCSRCHDSPHLALLSEPSTSTSKAKLPRASLSESRLACLCTLLGRLRILLTVRCTAEQQAALSQPPRWCTLPGCYLHPDYNGSRKTTKHVPGRPAP